MSKKKNSMTHPDPGVRPSSSTVGKTARNARAGPSTSPVAAPPIGAIESSNIINNNRRGRNRNTTSGSSQRNWEQQMGGGY